MKPAKHDVLWPDIVMRRHYEMRQQRLLVQTRLAATALQRCHLIDDPVWAELAQ